ncbi:protein FATTY ACID EXPORT 4, chloroplastic [Malania oleifera]|uniref:protein FATTY ACID EXPORT 4, chloroplastic n=1 Tax=Malania oleifera TaxID=397392 RepID=UPI0025AE7A7C|nr:protein FATTY ACID EXPORT 4, chloroplastic [Malania oleifera]
MMASSLLPISATAMGSFSSPLPRPHFSLSFRPLSELKGECSTFFTISTTVPAVSSRRRHCSFRCNSRLADLAPATSAAYGVLLLGGGLFAYTRSRSKGSLLGGFAGAALMATAYVLIQAPETKEIGDALGFGSAFLFSCIFGIRLVATRKVIPAGPLLGLSVSALAVFISDYLQNSP